MITFNQFLYEYLLPRQKTSLQRAVAKAYPDHDNYMTSFARKATDHFFGEGNDDVKEELKNYDGDKSEIHQKVERHLGKPITQEEYKSGMTLDKHGRQAKIGKMIRDPSLRNEYASDNARAGVKQIKQHYVTVSRGIEVGGQTNSRPNAEHPKGHSWGEMSCKNVDTGINKKYLPHEIANGTATVRVHDHNGQEIYRATLQPYLHGSGKTAYSVDAEYGVKHPSFSAHAHDVAKRLSQDHEEHEGPYIKHPDVYNDNGINSILHPKATEDEIKKSAKSDIVGDRVAAMSMRHTPRDVIKQGLRDNSSHVRVAAVQHHSNTAEDLENHRKHETDPYVQAEIMRHRNASDDTIRAGLQHRNLFIKAHARNAATARGIDWKAEEQKNKPKEEAESFL